MSKLTEYTANTTPALTDIMMVVDDPGGTPLTQKITLSSLLDFFQQQTVIYLSNNVNTISSTTSETTMLGSADVGSLVFAAGYFTVNKTVKITLYGTLATIGVPGNLTVKTKFGSSVLASTGAVALQASQTDVGCRLEVLLNCVSVGASGSMFIEGEFVYGDGFRLPLVNLNVITIDTTGALTLNVTGQFSVNDPAQTLNTILGMVERIY
jgi:hypothetical protein